MLFCIVSAGTVLLLATSPIIFNILCRNKSLYEAFNYTPVLIIATYFYCFSQFFGSIYVAKKNAKNMSITTTMAAIINIVINLILIQQIGVLAAVLSSLVANLFLAGYRFIDLNRKYCRLRINKRLTILSIIVILIISLLAYCTDQILWVLNIVLALGYAYFISGDIFIAMFKSFIKKR